MKNLSDYMSVSEAAEFIGVTPLTLRNWDKSGKLKAARNPINGYRMYEKEALEEFLLQIQQTQDSEAQNG